MDVWTGLMYQNTCLSSKNGMSDDQLEREKLNRPTFYHQNSTRKIQIEKSNQMETSSCFCQIQSQPSEHKMF